jgi:predicted trehalose synthase
MLNAFTMDRAVRELGNELLFRRDWLHVPLRSIIHLVDPSK